MATTSHKTTNQRKRIDNPEQAQELLSIPVQGRTGERSLESLSVGREDHQRLPPHEEHPGCDRKHARYQGAQGAGPLCTGETSKRRPKPGVPYDGHALDSVPGDGSGQTDVAQPAPPRPFLQAELDVLVVKFRWTDRVNGRRRVGGSNPMGEVVEGDRGGDRIARDTEDAREATSRLWREDTLEKSGERVDHQWSKNEIFFAKRRLVVLSAEQLPCIVRLRLSMLPARHHLDSP